MDAAWAGVPLYVSANGDYLDLHGNYQVRVWHPSGTTPPPSPAAMSAEDLDFRDVLIEAFESMNLQVASSVSQARNSPLPLPLPPATDSRGFWRIKADWSVDSDVDGSPDWLELEIMGDPDHPYYALANPFDGDVDQNGVADGDQLDADLDGTPDSRDTVPTDSTFNQPVAALPRYALFPINSAQPASEDPAPLQINDRGRVLYVNGTWSGGVWKGLEKENQANTLTGAKARSMNDLDEIVGWGNYRPQDDPVVEGMHVVYWSAPTVKPAPLVNGDMFAAKPEIDLVFPIQGYRSSPFLSNDGQVIVIASKIDIDPSSGNPAFVPVPGNNHYIWTLPGEGRVSTHLPVEAGMKFIKSNELYWGIDPQDNTKGVISGLNDPEGFFGAPANVFEPVDPSTTAGAGTIAFSASRNGYVFHPNEGSEEGRTWRGLSTGSSGIDMSDDGTIIMPSGAGLVAPMVLNGKFIPLVKAAPATGNTAIFPPDDNRYINKNTAMLDTTPGGWILAENGPTGYAPGNDYSVLLPLKFEGNLNLNGDGVVHRTAVGVDAYSIYSNNPGNAVKDCIWIMAPSNGGETRVKLTAPVHSSAPVTISGQGLKFNGNQATLTIAGPETEFTIKADDNMASGSEIPLSLKFGTTSSVSYPVRAKVMKRRTVKVTLWSIASDVYPDRGPDKPAHPSVPPAFNPTAEQVENYLNKIFESQINAVFECEPKAVTVPLDFDSANGSEFGAPAQMLDAKNDSLDVNEFLRSSETDEITSRNWDRDKNINIYLLGGIRHIRFYRWDAQKGKLISLVGIDDQGNPKDSSGFTDRDNRRIFIEAGSSVTTLQDGLDTIAHEVGHMLFGEGHPDENGGRAPLPGAPTKLLRLMASGQDLKPKDGSARLTVKQEWDEAKRWFDEEIEADRME